MIETDENGDAFPILIDFGAVTKYTDSAGIHLDQPNESASKFCITQWWFASDKN